MTIHKTRGVADIDKQFGVRIRTIRVQQGLSQDSLAQAVGVSFQQIQKYEKGINRIGASRLFDLAQVLGVSVQFFYDEAPGSAGRAGGAFASAVGFAERPADNFVVDFLSSREGIELNKAFVRIDDPKVRRSLVDLVRSVAGEDKVAD
jgi:transcriptional regulator with XRE-family HTH domain